MPTYAKTLLRSPKIASRVFGWDSPGQLVRSTPRTKFMFKAEFQPSDMANSMMNQAPLNSSTDIRSVAFKVKSIDKPRVNITTVDLNQYNKKKIVYSKVDYGEASLRLYDTVDNSVFNLWINYFTYFFGDSRQKSDSDYWQSPVNSEYLDSTGWGFRPIAENTNFFDYIQVSALFGDTITSFQYINPKITSVDWQNYDYSSTDLEEVTISIKYEAIKFFVVGQPYKSSGQFDDGWLATDTLNLTTTTTGVSTQFNSFQPRLFASQSATYNSAQVTQGNIGSTPQSSNQSNNKTAVAPGASIDSATTANTTQSNSVGNERMVFDVPSDSTTISSTAPDITTNNDSGTIKVNPYVTTATSTSTNATGETVTTTTTTVEQLNVGGSPWVPGQELTQRQVNAVKLRIQTNNPVNPFVLAQYKKQTQSK